MRTKKRHLRRETAAGLALAMMAALFAFPLAGPAAAEETTVMTAPYARSYATGTGIANEHTGIVSAVAATVSGFNLTSGSAGVGAHHVLSEDASSIDYEVLITKNATMGALWFAWSDFSMVVSATGGGASTVSEVPLAPGPQTVHLTLSSSSVIPKGTVVSIWVEVKATAGSCNVLVGGCSFFSLQWTPTVGFAQGIVNSIIATSHAAEPTPDPTPEPSPTPTIHLEASGYKDRGLQKADLSWTEATSTSIDVYRDGDVVATTENDGFYTDHIDQRGKGTYVYQVCEVDTNNCSNEAVVEF